jgi:IS30 family transposase
MIISILLNGGDLMASKHLSYEERLKIQEGLSQNKAIFAIAKSIKRTNTAIRNEITRNRYLVTEKSYTIHTCENRNDCYLMHVCGDMECNKYCMGCI